MGEIVHSGAFVFGIVGRWLTALEVTLDGMLVDRHGIEVEPIGLDEEVLTVRAVASAVIQSGKRTRLDVVCSDGLVLPTEIGKGRNTLGEIIRLRCGDKAEAVTAAYKARYFEVETAQAA